jgi:hypothetical protein
VKNILSLVSLLVLIGLAVTAQQPAKKIIVPNPRTPREKSLDPAQFRDPDTRKAYQIARDNPKLLEHLACYCGCMTSEAVKHSSNYDCFTDRHGEG